MLELLRWREDPQIKSGQIDWVCAHLDQCFSQGHMVCLREPSYSQETTRWSLMWSQSCLMNFTELFGLPFDPAKSILRAASSPGSPSLSIFFSFTSENYLIRWGSSGMPKEIEKLNNLQAVFTVSPPCLR